MVELFTYQLEYGFAGKYIFVYDFNDGAIYSHTLEELEQFSLEIVIFLLLEMGESCLGVMKS